MSRVLLSLSVFCVAAAPLSDDAIHKAAEYLQANQPERALHLLEAAAKTANDPGLIAFNRGLALARLGRFREAELQFELCDTPPSRLARANYNRGICLLQRDEPDAIRAAIECFMAVRDEPDLATDARHNLEAAKLRWARLKANRRTGDSSGTSDPDPSATLGREGLGDPNPIENVRPMRTVSRNDAEPATSPKTLPGAGTLPVLRDDTVLNPMLPEDAQRLLDAAVKRIERQRRAIENLRAGPSRSALRDW